MSKEFEDKLLGSLILYPEAWELVADLELDDFRDVKNRKIFSVLKALRDKGDEGGDGYAIRIVNALKAKGDFEAIGGANEIARLANSVPNGAHAEFYLQGIRKMKNKEQQIEQVYQDFWKPLIEKDGVLDIAQMKRELFDFWQVMQSVPKVYDHVTGGKVSKILTDPDVVIALADDNYQDDPYDD